ncbi:MAG: hypothetical protein FWH14_00280 [Oscillospiraceae bacterium]|nr:hypothetical protein [Oscillospiraceae bacterium]
MTAHELMVKTNHYLIKDGELTAMQKDKIVRQLLVARSDQKTKQSFYKGVGAGTGTYPVYFIPPFNDNKKLQTVIPMSPKTHILSSNAYELDILRLLSLFAPDHPTVREMVAGTLERLENSCPGGDCCQGECFHSSLPVLRFFTVAAPDEKEWMCKLAAKINNGIDNKYKDNATRYYWLCLSELPFDVAEPGLIKYKDKILSLINKSAPMNTEHAKTYQPVMYYIYRNCLSRFPEYAYIKERQPYVSEKDERLHFDSIL